MLPKDPPAAAVEIIDHFYSLQEILSFHLIVSIFVQYSLPVRLL